MSMLRIILSSIILLSVILLSAILLSAMASFLLLHRPAYFTFYLGGLTVLVMLFTHLSILVEGFNP